MKRLLPSIIAATLVASIAPLSAELDIVRVWPGYREATSFTSASEYFGGPAAKSDRLARRTQPAERAGYYWLVRTKSDSARNAATARLEVTREGSTEPNTYELSWDIRAGKNAVSFGVTGTDWADPSEVPIAWRITLFSSDGTQLASSTSFLWKDN